VPVLGSEPPHRARGARAEPAARNVKGGLNVPLTLGH